MPFITVLIPTRNRAHLLRSALQSVLAQNFDDYELIVSDNDSTDHTCELVNSFSDSHVRYIRPEKYLPVYQHWNFAIQSACGDYVLLLADDDCLAPRALEKFANTAQTFNASIVGCQFADYFVPDYPIATQRNTIFVPNFSGAIKTLTSQQVLGGCFAFDPVFYPHVTTLLKRDLIQSLFQRFGYFFERPFPEYVAYSMAYSVARQYILIDEPLVVLGRTPNSLGPSYFWFGFDSAWGEVGDKFFQHVPLSGTFITNGIAESLLRAKHNLLENFRGIEIAWDAYYRNYYADMLAQQELGRDVARERDEFTRAIDTLPPDLGNAIRNAMRELTVPVAPSAPATGPTRSNLRARLGALKQKLTRAEPPKPPLRGFVRGEQAGVADILSCARWLATLNPDQSNMES